MNCWSHLPTDILHIVFEYLDGEHATLDSAKNFSFYSKPTRDISQCQMTCKSWSKLAQIVFYKNVELYYTTKRAESFVHTLRYYNLGPFVENIIFVFKGSNFQNKLIPSLFPVISYRCPDLKGIYTNSEIELKLWKYVHMERSKGSFLKLQEITSPSILREHNDLAIYNEVAYSLRESLRHFTIYHGKPAPIENLEHFTNIHTLCFKLDRFDDLYTIDQQTKRCFSVKSIDIKYAFYQYSESKEHLILTELSPAIQICPQVKQLLATEVLFESKLCDYLMKAFPNINKLKLRFEFYLHPATSDRLSNNTGLQFLGYLMKMSNASVSRLPVRDLDNLLMNFQHINGINRRHISISYKRCPGLHGFCYLTMSISEQKIDILVSYIKDRPINLPRIGMIEKSGRKLQSLTLNMNLEYKFMKDLGMDVSYNGTDFHQILLYCPNLKNIYILNTSLPSFGMCLQQKQRLSLDTFSLDRCFIGSEFLPALPFYVNYINTLIIRDTNIIGETKVLNNKYIEMADIELNNICFFEKLIVHRIFLKLEKTREDSVRWFVSKDNKFETCTEDEYKESLHDQFSMTFTICCADIRTIEINFTGHNIIFKT